MGLRSEQKERRKETIIWAAVDQFLSKGYSTTKIEDIAKAAGMSSGLLFHYFNSKENLYEELIKMGMDGKNVPFEMDFSSPLAFFQNYIIKLLSLVKEKPQAAKLFVLTAQAQRGDGAPERIRRLARNENTIEFSAELIRLGQMQGSIRKGDAVALSLAFWCSVQGIMEQLAVSETSPVPDPDWLLDILRGK
ncbi:TetR/AcrR family transcriptional regulator [Lacrimispora sp. NSJ-141]|uniref:TetR/AcrR family transcriptional regulator n=1 Tax=Lientehia hominis TaxID=2897778 RepID=A0AAP2RHM7_9FIRM|nr:TetR/AcrR family transcriptional regulator [Lientehia hominis]MCD2491010.1 TetR/AcrR family transcriptional regulator [Lientehia hominis]